MNFSNLERLSEIQRRLEQNLKDLWVKAKFFNDEGRLGICFESKDGSRACPVVLFFSDNGMSQWDGCELLQWHWASCDLGDSGWTHYENLGHFDATTLGEDADEAMNQIRSTIGQAGTIQHYNGRNKVISSEELAAAFKLIDAELGIYVSINCEREGDIESLLLTDPNDVDWKISFSEKGNMVFANGKLVKSFFQYDVIRLAKFVSSSVLLSMDGDIPPFG
ncbi:hypothetical protein LJR251_002115 [Rhizobium rhizogenes]|uniref:hypothetical protein n=1 Tax=Rhizobium rhizogenes TaxID=359 RepID=UPI003ECE02B6